ncbi:MAG TPA: LLM class flavin-dependent oxidoreductase [Candidatus Stackebrandtia excrementipullorum]|nr:LLM class flavin-dependent oxidoreductase [Candidatus Stackebrandtia excrementipullorum]
MRTPSGGFDNHVNTRPIRISVLDRSALRGEEEPAAAIRATVDMARHAEILGFMRFWVAEHHSVPGIAGSAPTVLTSAVAAATTSIRVGTGGIMLPNHNPLVVAEQIGTLDALYPGRIDIGLGRSQGFTPAVRAALGSTGGPEDFAERLALLLGYLTGDQDTHPGVHARPGEGAAPCLAILATGAGAEIAAQLGLPLVLAPVSGLDAAASTISAYRQEFTPSHWLRRPDVTIAVPVAVGETTEQARDLLISEAWSMVLSRTLGEFTALRSPEQVQAEPKTVRQHKLLDKSLADSVYGTGEQVRAELARLIAVTNADELLVTTAAYDRPAQVSSWKRLAELVSTF